MQEQTCRPPSGRQSMSIKPELVRPGLFRDRREAGRLLAVKLAKYADRPDVIVLALPRGGVPVAYEVASALDTTYGRFCRSQAWNPRLRGAGDGRGRDRRGARAQ